MTTCRFCKEAGPEKDMVKYGLRHWAHHACYLKAGKHLTSLHDWQIANFPWRLIKQHKLEIIAFGASERIKARQEKIDQLTDKLWERTAALEQAIETNALTKKTSA